MSTGTTPLETRPYSVGKATVPHPRGPFWFQRFCIAVPVKGV